MKKITTIIIALLILISCVNTSVLAADSIDRTINFDNVTSISSGVAVLKYMGVYSTDYDGCALNTDTRYTHNGSAKSLLLKNGAARRFFYNSDSAVISSSESTVSATVQNCYQFDYTYYMKIPSFESSYTSDIVYSDDIYLKKAGTDSSFAVTDGLQLRVMSNADGKYITTTDASAIKVFPWENGKNEWVQIRRLVDFERKSIATYADGQMISKKDFSETGLYSVRCSYIKVLGKEADGGVYFDDVHSESLTKPALEIGDIAYEIDHASGDNVVGRVTLEGNGTAQSLMILSAKYDEGENRLANLYVTKTGLLSGEVQKNIKIPCGKPGEEGEILIFYLRGEDISPIRSCDKLRQSSVANDIIELSQTKLYRNYPNSGTYERPTPEKILADYEDSAQYQSHPRVMLTPAKVVQLKEQIAVSGSKKNLWYGRLLQRRNQLYGQLTGGESDNYIMTHTECHETRMPNASGNLSDNFKDQMLICGLLYQLTGDDIHAKTAWIQIEAVSSFPNWNTTHDLDYGMIAQGYAIAYDWMYTYWSAEQRNIMENAIYNLCFNAANRSYENNRLDGTVMGVWVANNHNPIVNAGIEMAALAFMDVYPQIASALAVDAIRSLEFFTDLYAPDGALPDGYEYWVLGARHMTAAFASIESALGDLYGLDEASGVDKAAIALKYIASDILGYNFGDSDNGLISCPGELWLYSHYGINGFKDSLVAQSRYNTPNSSLAELILWYNPAQESGGVTLERDMKYDEHGFATLRSDFAAGQSFLGVRGGTLNKAYFNHLDQGSFVFDALGVRWVYDIGKDDYQLPGYMQPASDNRWKIFRLRPEGHSALVINPNSTLAGYEFGKTAPLTIESGTSRAKAVVDMTAVQGSKVSSAKRGFMLTDNRSSLAVRDEVTLTGSSQVYWIMYTKATVSINGNSVLLTDKTDTGKTLTIDFLSSQSGTLYAEAASPCTFSPVVTGQNSNSSYTRIVYKLSGVSGALNITAKLTPKNKGLTDVSQYNTSISGWSVN